METGEFHWTNGWYFKRLDDSSVRVRKKNGDEIVAEAIIPSAEWVSIILHVSKDSYMGDIKAAEKFHG